MIEKPRQVVLNGLERQIYRLLAEGVSVTEIADQLRMSRQQLYVYLERMMDKFGVSNRDQLVAAVSRESGERRILYRMEQNLPRILPAMLARLAV